MSGRESTETVLKGLNGQGENSAFYSAWGGSQKDSNMIWLTLHSISLAIVQQTDSPVKKPGKLRGCCSNLGTSWWGLNTGGSNGGDYTDLPSSQGASDKSYLMCERGVQGTPRCGLSQSSKLKNVPVRQNPTQVTSRLTMLTTWRWLFLSHYVCSFYINKAAWSQFVYNLKIPEDFCR